MQICKYPSSSLTWCDDKLCPLALSFVLGKPIVLFDLLAYQPAAANILTPMVAGISMAGDRNNTALL